MFGYVLPYKKELTESEWQSYRASYCGLCHTLGKRYGFFSRFLLNYDFTLLAMLLSHPERAPECRCRRCISSPFKGRYCYKTNDGYEKAADISLLLVYWKLKDEIEDQKGIGKLPAWLGLALFSRAFNKAKRNARILSDSIGMHLKSLSDLEKSYCSSLDKTADQFALILADLVPTDVDTDEKRIIYQILYHLGRWIYLIDAVDDLEDDLKEKNYNPIIYRYQLTTACSNDDLSKAKREIDHTILHSENIIISAMNLIHFGYYHTILENIFCGGLTMVRKSVISGEWKNRSKYTKQELKHI